MSVMYVTYAGNAYICIYHDVLGGSGSHRFVSLSGSVRWRFVADRFGSVRFLRKHGSVRFGSQMVRFKDGSWHEEAGSVRFLDGCGSVRFGSFLIYNRRFFAVRCGSRFGSVRWCMLCHSTKNNHTN